MNARGVTLVEVLITVIISSIALLAMAVPFVAERSFWATGQRQTEAQRDAQLIMRALTRVARESGSFAIDADGAGVRFYLDPNRTDCRAYFRGGPAFSGRFERYERCGAEPTVLIEGQSRLRAIVFEPVDWNLVRVRVDVTRQNREDERLETDLYLRNAG
jgi:prepilin-type N-terminal cleavage/methylation domain-containing protein